MATPLRKFRCPDELWARLVTLAGERGEDATAVILRAIKAYVGETTPDRVSELPDSLARPPQPVTPVTPAPVAQVRACRRCGSCTGYTADPRRMLTCVCGHSMGDHR